MKKKKQTKADFLRSWDMFPYAKLRYKGIAGVYWYWLSRQIRQEEFEKYGKCVSCGTKCNDWHEWDCGHFVASGDGGFATRFLRENLALQCKRCNNPHWCPDSSAFFALEINRRYGPGTAEWLLSMKGKKQKELKPSEYALLIIRLPSYYNRDILSK